MENDKKLGEIKELLKDEYEGLMTEKQIDEFASELYTSVFVFKFSLDEIFSLIDRYEDRANIESTKSYYVFCGTVDLLENGEETAQRLYDCFMYSWDILNLFLKLYLENEEYISEEKMEMAKKKALKTFDREILAICGITQ